MVVLQVKDARFLYFIYLQYYISRVLSNNAHDSEHHYLLMLLMRLFFLIHLIFVFALQIGQNRRLVICT